MLVKLPRH